MLILKQSPKIIGKGSMGFHSVSWPLLDKLTVRLVSSADKRLGKWEGVILETAACLGTVRLCGVDMKGYIEAKET